MHIFSYPLLISHETVGLLVMSLHQIMLISGLQSKFVEKSRGVFVKGVRESSFKHLEVFIFAFLKGLITWSHLLHFDIFLVH